jgi:hypothetical protein
MHIRGMSFLVSGLDPDQFSALSGMDDAELRARNVHRERVTAKPGAPCRITLDDAEVGEEVLLLSYEHQPAHSPYRQGGPIFIRKNAALFVGVDIIPPALARRPLSLRGFDADHMMIEAELVDGAAAGALVECFFANSNVAYIHAHYARRGCYAALIERA